jgi:hypothetical protein
VRFLTIDSIEKILKVIFVAFCVAFFSSSAFSGVTAQDNDSSESHSHGVLKPKTEIVTVTEKDYQPSAAEPNKRTNNQDLKQVRSTINDGASRIVKSLGCLAEVNNNQFDRMVEEWGKKIYDLGEAPKMITEKTRYSSYLRFVAWDYLKSEKICNSTSNRCYQRLYKPVDELFALLREGDLNNETKKKKLEDLKIKISDVVKSILDENNTKPACLALEEHVLDDKKVSSLSETSPVSDAKVDTKEDEAKDVKQVTAMPTRKSLLLKPDALADHSVKEELATSDKSKVASDETRQDPVNKQQQLGSSVAKYKKALLAAGADPRAVDHSLSYFEANRDKFKNQSYISVIDATKRSSDEPYFLLNTKTLEVKRYDVTYGSGSVAVRNGIPTNFSKANVSGSHQTPAGALLVGAKTSGNIHSRVTLLHGLEARNKAALSRAVVMHDSPYVHNGGRSHGCPAFDPKDFREIQPLVSGGSFLYIYSPFADNSYRRDSRST